MTFGNKEVVVRLKLSIGRTVAFLGPFHRPRSAWPGRCGHTGLFRWPYGKANQCRSVIDLVSDDARKTMQRLMQTRPTEIASDKLVGSGSPVRDDRRGYLQHLNTEALADWAAQKGVTLYLNVRVGHFIFPGMTVAEVRPSSDEAIDAFRRASVVGGQRASADDPQFAVRQLVEVAVRALSPSINDPYTAISVLDRLGSLLCDIVPLHLGSGDEVREGKIVLRSPTVNYGGLTNSMFQMIRQNASGCVAVLAHQIDMLNAVSSCEADPGRRAHLCRHTRLVMADAERTVGNPSDLKDIRRRFEISASSSP